MSHRIGRLDGLRQRGITLVLVEVDLKEFKERDLTQEKLDEVRRAFAVVRQHGPKVIIRCGNLYLAAFDSLGLEEYMEYLHGP
jgi:Domain of unknown function (DUF4874)